MGILISHVNEIHLKRIHVNQGVGVTCKMEEFCLSIIVKWQDIWLIMGEHYGYQMILIQIH